MKDHGRGPATYVVPWAPHLLNWALGLALEFDQLYLGHYSQLDNTLIIPWSIVLLLFRSSVGDIGLGLNNLFW